ncbi:nitroreductase family deazaflavin-dependent oxidoreductase [Nocardiopsis sp. MG754419]|uniref:nitroreductase family deazaflavin-dependent oxidoreductase n=1 Tax=Nocardiopsis sp. MG754419 TaxID=2259865 RepID=UPI001BA6698D|nr:nitroreductase family deazaflavin-dependent oxidoreductase [Nocardiopsis sp. MG754419]MBR8743996.1 nitroreductase family deazaflavin-dependent oxidoreductase [Nocardiopsis sp. MG754419]
MTYPPPAHTQSPPDSPLGRALLRAPVWLFRLGLGDLFVGRFVLLTHRGRHSGEPRQAVLEVLETNDVTGAVLVASGFGDRAQWYRNIRHEPRVLFQVGRRRRRGTATPLPPEESGRVLAHQAQKRPETVGALMRALGHDVDGDPRVYERLGADPHHGIPVVRLLPDHPPGPRFPRVTAR